MRNLKDKKAQGLPVNVVVMIIIGLIIFGIGMGLFAKLSSSGEDLTSDLESKIKNDISSLECDGEDWICFPTAKMKNGDKKTFEIFIANRGEDEKEFNVTIDWQEVDSNTGDYGINKTGCGAVLGGHYTGEINVKRGFSGSVPVVIQASRVSKTPCSFIITAELNEVNGGSNPIAKTPIIISVE